MSSAINSLFPTIASLQGKHVEGNQEGSVNVKKMRTWRQYMNRRGGFNRCPISSYDGRVSCTDCRFAGHWTRSSNKARTSPFMDRSAGFLYSARLSNMHSRYFHYSFACHGRRCMRSLLDLIYVRDFSTTGNTPALQVTEGSEYTMMICDHEVRLTFDNKYSDKKRES